MEYIKTEGEPYGDKCGLLFSEDFRDKRTAKPTLLLHSCCGPCSTSVTERLVADYNVTVFFYNPNITDEEEYKLRRDEQLRFIRTVNETCAFADKIGFIEGEYCPGKFLELVKGLEHEPEGGARCDRCFAMRLDHTAVQAKLLGYDAFATTLTVSPHKNYAKISAIASGVSFLYGVDFLDMDFKKKAGFQRSMELSKKYDLYRQRYCGCQFSK